MTALGRRGIAITAGLLVGAATLTGCTKDPKFVDPDVPVGSFGLVAFDSCQQALDGLRKAAKAIVGPYGFGGPYAMEDGVAARAGTAGAPVPAPAMADSTAKSTAETPAYSGTNTHESGVDEPDLVKTDGRRIVTISNGRLRVIDAASKRVTGTVDLSDGTGNSVMGDLLLAGDHALVLANQGYAYRGGPVVDIAPAQPSTSDPAGPVVGPSLLLVDLAHAKVLSRANVDGSLVDARQVGSVARVVVRSAPRLEFPTPSDGNSEQRTAANQAVIDAAPIESWTPRVEVTTGGTTKRSQVDCDAISRPATYSGTNMLTVLTFDLAANGLTDGAPVSIVADGDTVYSNGPNLYVASNQGWRAMVADGGNQPPEVTTEVYKFSTSTKERPRFVAGGSVPGRLINQYAMSEWDGKLRVATTTDPVVFADGQRITSHSGVYVLGEDDGTLKNIGAVDGLGKGERIYSVRFVGPIGYVVTFRQTDPLYTVDLGDPAHPTVKGELKIPGYSAYLHPADDSRLIGVGQDATDQGRVTGTQVSLFDVRDLANPSRMAQFKLAGTYSEAEFEPHAFLYWPADGLLVVPLQGRGTVTNSRIAQTQGALVLRVSDSAIGEVGFLSHPSYSPIRRSLIIDSTLWTVSDAGLMASDKSSLARLAWIAF
jgi:uncharacterized secreted protein with C-terminal beta-propeller domain